MTGGLGGTGEGWEDWPKVLPVSRHQWRYPSTPLNWDTNTGNTFIRPMCHHSRVPCICMGLSENIQSPICLGQANLRIMNHMWCVSDMQLESSPDVSTGLLPVLKKEQWIFKGKPTIPHQERQMKEVNKHLLPQWVKQKSLFKKNALECSQCLWKTDQSVSYVYNWGYTYQMRGVLRSSTEEEVTWVAGLQIKAYRWN